MSKPCPSCKILIKHERGHGDHIILCNNCNSRFCFQCLFIFKRKHLQYESSLSDPESSLSDPESCINKDKFIIKQEYLHYKYSNCSRICNDKCNCTDCFLCSLEIMYGSPTHPCKCFIKECTLRNTYAKKMKDFYGKN